MKFNFRQFIFAREYRGYSQTELSSKIVGLSQSNLSKFEKGVSLLSDDVIQKIIVFLEFPESFFTKKINNLPENAHYRKKATISKQEKLNIENSNRIIGYIVDQMTDSVEWPDFNLQPLNVDDGYSPENIAKHTRKLLKIKEGEPVKEICTLLERSGIIIIEADTSEKFDGVSFQTDNYCPIIIINKNFSNDRKRFTIAHELGHLLMHVLGDFPISDLKVEKIREMEANRFASEFLMPSEYIIHSLRNLKMSYLAELKKYWLTSMSSIIRRAFDLKCIDTNKYTYHNIELSRDGKKKKEDIEVYIDKPSLFTNAYILHKLELDYSDEDFTNAFNLPIDIIKRFCNIKNNNGKLRIMQ